MAVEMIRMPVAPIILRLYLISETCIATASKHHFHWHGLMKNIVANENRPSSGRFSFGFLFLHHLHINRDSGGKAQVSERFHNLSARVDDIDQAAVHTHFKLFSGIFEYE